MATIAVPESLNFYSLPAHRAALDRIREADGLPRGLVLDEARQFHLARLTDLKVRTDYWCLLHDLWRAIWHDLTDGLDPVPFGDVLWDDGAGEIHLTWAEHLLSASHRLGEDKLLWTAVSLHPNGHSLRLMLSVDRVNGGHDPDWLAFPPPEGWVLVDDDGEDYAPFWRAEVPDATEVEGRIGTEAAATLAADAVAPVYAITRV